MMHDDIGSCQICNVNMLASRPEICMQIYTHEIKLEEHKPSHKADGKRPITILGKLPMAFEEWLGKFYHLGPEPGGTMDGSCKQRSHDTSRQL